MRTVLDGENRKRVPPSSICKVTIPSQLPFVDGSAGLPRNTPHTVDRVSGLPEKTHDVSGGSSRVRENMSDTVDRLSRLPQNMPANGGWSRQLPGRMPDSDDDLSWLPENGPGTVGRLPCLQKETAANAVGFFSLRGNAPGNAGRFFARWNREGNMGVGEVFWVVQPEFNGEVLFSPRVTTTSVRRSSRISSKNVEIHGLTLFYLPSPFTADPY